jgi:hypothetical protein
MNRLQTLIDKLAAFAVAAGELDAELRTWDWKHQPDARWLEPRHDAMVQLQRGLADIVKPAGALRGLAQIAQKTR